MFLIFLSLLFAEEAPRKLSQVTEFLGVTFFVPKLVQCVGSTNRTISFAVWNAACQSLSIIPHHSHENVPCSTSKTRANLEVGTEAPFRWLHDWEVKTKSTFISICLSLLCIVRIKYQTLRLFVFRWFLDQFDLSGQLQVPKDSFAPIYYIILYFILYFIILYHIILYFIILYYVRFTSGFQHQHHSIRFARNSRATASSAQAATAKTHVAYRWWPVHACTTAQGWHSTKREAYRQQHSFTITYLWSHWSRKVSAAAASASHW